MDDRSEPEPLSPEELASLIEYLAEVHPEDRAEVYFGSPFSGRVELIVFAQRLAAVAWLHAFSAPETDGVLEWHREEMASGAYVIEGWGVEPLEAAREEEGMLEQALTLQYGSFELMAIAALETLFGDLLPVSGRPRGLLARFRAWADANDVQAEMRERWGAEFVGLATLRNRFAHELDGSPWETREAEAPNRERVEETLLRVGHAARWVDEILEQKRVREGSKWN